MLLKIDSGWGRGMWLVIVAMLVLGVVVRRRHYGCSCAYGLWHWYGSHKIEDRQLCGEWRGRGKQRVISASTLHFYLDIAIVCCWAVCGLSTCAIFRQGSTRTNTTPVRFNVGLLVEAGDGGGGAPVPGSYSRP